MGLPELPIAGLQWIEPTVYRDERGCFFESFNERVFAELVGMPVRFVQDNQSLSRRGVLRGLHFQQMRPQGKLVRVLRGEVFDVVVDLRAGSPSYGQHVSVTMSAAEPRQLWIPPGFAHGFLVLSDEAELLYKTTDYWDPADERAIRWNDPDLAIAWPTGTEPLLSAKDRSAPSFAQARPVTV
ncbi:dTDP-4-dehydrorhamnose 3,5-epimerase [Jeongeupia naejangsanensis]|uniref:dTDP-4-dehydrorhamnose 3,5-epimerase n=1 Tax=Jeongeupia naejangsanensis TaxID=613195 RepID=A0ABS2BP59_9NEIS|nr:dTDP-4-dehydrorhamnose 3,5-epimerase [Jeongeupia naejangsanensis]MBM3117407.1 dTDP-4-dehydrorhamnose 3,5-epimerase [Jeongeupia naejangsanensis]